MTGFCANHQPDQTGHLGRQRVQPPLTCNCEEPTCPSAPVPSKHSWFRSMGVLVLCARGKEPSGSRIYAAADLWLNCPSRTARGSRCGSRQCAKSEICRRLRRSKSRCRPSSARSKVRDLDRALLFLTFCASSCRLSLLFASSCCRAELSR